MKKNSGKISDGIRKSAGLVRKLWIERQATARAALEKLARLMCAPACVCSAALARTIAITAIAAAMPKPSASASASQPVISSERMPSIRYETGL